ncbi:MAG: hypothetical protein QGH39_06470 [Candidatus Thermoplasmatota archaeon]|nr:hypothetical protein [Candidatus Thermoplasmatota archaeon]MDP7265187.1 hypothetical protein [Candidatus Thermoplasmatota archaeon]
MRSRYTVQENTLHTQGGYYHIYAARDPLILMEELRTSITKWYGRMLTLIEEAEKKTGTLHGLTHHFNKRAIFSETVRDMIREENTQTVEQGPPKEEIAT